MRAAYIAVPVAATAATLTRWPDLWLGLAATLLAITWIASTLLGSTKPRFQGIGPVSAIALALLPTAPDAVLPIGGIFIGGAIGFALLSALPPRHEGVHARPGFGAWIPVLGVTAALILPLLVPLLFGPDRLGAMVDRTAPAQIAVVAALLALAATGFVLLTRKEVTA